jgi:hypothetical protein
MRAYICTGCNDEPCYFIFDNAIGEPDMCPYGDVADWHPIDIKDIIDVLGAECTE